MSCWINLKFLKTEKVAIFNIATIEDMEIVVYVCYKVSINQA